MHYVYDRRVVRGENQTALKCDTFSVVTPKLYSNDRRGPKVNPTRTAVRTSTDLMYHVLNMLLHHRSVLDVHCSNLIRYSGSAHEGLVKGKERRQVRWLEKGSRNRRAARCTRVGVGMGGLYGLLAEVACAWQA